MNKRHRYSYNPIPYIAIIVFSLACNKDDPTPVNLDPNDLVGNYCGILFYDSDVQKTFGDGIFCSVEIQEKDTLIIRGDFSAYINEFTCFIRNDSIIIPDHRVTWTNQSPGGSTWQEHVLYFGHGEYDDRQNKLTIRLYEWGSQTNDAPLVLEVLKEPFVNLEGSYYSNYEYDRGHAKPTYNDEIHITNDPVTDSLHVNFVMNYRNRIDSALMNFKVENLNCMKRFEIAIDSITMLSGTLAGNGDYLRINAWWCMETMDPHAPRICTTYSHIFSGFKEKIND